MRELKILSSWTDDPVQEDPGATRERLKGAFPAGSTRRMTTLGMLVGSALSKLQPAPGDSIVYASQFAESRALESFIDSFPAASPTLFQTSIQPSAVQQAMIGRRHPVREYLPMCGGKLLCFHALRAAALSPAPRVLLCGGEERGTWLVEHGLASDRTFAFALALAASGDAAGTLRLEPGGGDGSLDLAGFFDALATRSSHSSQVAPGWRLEIAWA